ncbi:tartrate dehydrogenase [uncultured Vibrio sp.]|uniref:tartrate dehydrogenase n=1 Tax=uncultured Vibrio sp. TaxID=114054 RepID=UPI0029C93D68|nr:tartrate dehydrogenase [uncultured Vibrio sp.]
MEDFKIAVIPGDGIGKEVTPEGIKVINAALSRNSDCKMVFDNFDWSCETYLETGRMMPEDGMSTLLTYDSIYLGAVGFPSVPDHVSLWGLLLPIRKQFQQYINLRPVRLFDGVDCPLKDKKVGDIDFWVVRENIEGEYSDIGGRFAAGTDDEFVLQQSVFTKKGTDRVIKYAFELATKLDKKHVTSATKSNGLYHSMPFWDERFHEIAKDYDCKTDQYHIDILTANIVNKPEMFDVIVGSNLFGDIISDLGPGCTGTIAIAPSANINPEKNYPSMFEPVHGSAPDIYGKNIANPIGTIWAGAMMLDHLGFSLEHDIIVKAIENVIARGANLTPDMGGNASTQDLGTEIEHEVLDLLEI